MLQNYSSGFIHWRAESSMTAVARPTAAHLQGPGRSALVSDMTRVLLSSRGCGALLVGRRGVGKSYLAKQVIDNLPDSAEVVHLRGSSTLSRVEYGALGPLLSELDVAALDHHRFLIGGIARLLSSRGGSRPVVIVVENADRLDVMSAMVLMQVAAAGHACLLVVCTDEGTGSATIENLWGDGVLVRFDLSPLTFGEAELVLEDEFGKFSRTAVRQAWNLSKGNPRILLTLVSEQIASHILVQRDGIWVATGAAPQRQGLGGEFLTSWLDGLTDGQRDVVEILALAGAVQIDTLTPVCDPDDLDWLQENRHLQISPGPHRMADLRDSVMADVTRGSVPAARSRRLRARLAAKLSSEGNKLATPSFAAWTLNCGEPLDPEIALGAARAANGNGNPDQARRFVRSIEGHRLHAGLLIEELKALMTLGIHHEARSILEARLSDADWQPTFIEWAELMLLRATLPVKKSGAAGESIATLQGVWKRLAKESDTLSPAELRVLRSQLLLAEGTLLADQGQHAEVVQLLTYPYEHDDGDEENFRLQAGSLLCEAWAMAGRHDDALRFAADLELRLLQPGILELTKEYVRARLLIVFLMTAQPEKCGAILSSRPIPELGVGIHAVEERGVAEGLLHISHGRFDSALATLLPAISQLREGFAPAILGMALAECAYCYAVNDEPEEARRVLAELSRESYEQCWIGEQITTYLVLAANALLGSPDSSAQAMIDRAEECRQNGQPSMQLVFLTGAVRLGSQVAAPLLVGSAARIQGEFAGLCGDFGLAMTRRDDKRLLCVAKRALKAEGHSLARDIARAAMACADEAGDQATTREARRLIHSIDGRVGKQLPALGAAALAHLTKREREVALAAVPGATNIDISRKLNISVRTVEGHLYQVYSKLHLTSREDLQALAALGSKTHA
ncbi:LuxR C-terminal-related transcriptional regulator [Arthrobacter sp. TMT4-20]